MMNVTVYDIDGKKLEELTLPAVFSDVKVSVPLLHEVVTAYLANQRVGTACAKTRAEVAGGGAKPWRQKGTGRARAGSIRSPLWRKGGVVFGPRPKSYRQNLPKRKTRKALLMALYSKIVNNEIIVNKDFSLPEPKTKKIKQILDNLTNEIVLRTNKNGNSPQHPDSIHRDGKILLVVKSIEKNLKLAARNLKYVSLTPVNSLNAYDVLNAKIIIFTQEAFNELNLKK